MCAESDNEIPNILMFSKICSIVYFLPLFVHRACFRLDVVFYTLVPPISFSANKAFLIIQGKGFTVCSRKPLRKLRWGLGFLTARMQGSKSFSTYFQYASTPAFIDKLPNTSF